MQRVPLCTGPAWSTNDDKAAIVRLDTVFTQRSSSGVDENFRF